MALHTWGQRMNLHVHIHVIMTAGGLSIKRKGRKRNEATPREEEGRWVSFEQSDEALLACEFRKRFLRGLKRLYAKGELQLPRTLEFADVDSPEAFEEWLGPLERKMWMVDLQETADHQVGPSNLLRYLAKYFAGAAIRDARLLSDDGVHVTIGIRDYRNQCRDEVTMPGSEFVRRFLLHIVRGFRLRSKFLVETRSCQSCVSPLAPYSGRGLG